MPIKRLSQTSLASFQKHSNMLAGNPTYIPPAFELIQTSVLSTATNTVTFSSIPQTYKHLQLRIVTKVNSAGSASFNMQFNGDTGSNYRTHYIIGTGATTFSGDAGQATSMSIATAPGNDFADFYGGAVIDILDYANTNKNTTSKAFSAHNMSNDYKQLRLASGLWLNTAAVTSLTILTGTPTMYATSRLSLYGIAG